MKTPTVSLISELLLQELPFSNERLIFVNDNGEKLVLEPNDMASSTPKNFQVTNKRRIFVQFFSPVDRFETT